MSAAPTAAHYLARQDLQELIDLLIADDYEVIGPTIDQDAIVYRSIQSVSQLPEGWSDQQGPATYRLHPSGNNRYFQYNSGPESYKPFLFPSRQAISRATLDDDGWQFDAIDEPIPRLALLGVRACDLAAISIQDRVFRDDEFVDPGYQQRRDSALLIAIHCSTAAPTCFCSSMDTGPECKSGYDLLLTELDDGFLIETGSTTGASILSRLTTSAASDHQRFEAEQQVDQVKSAITKRLDTNGVYDLLTQNLEHPRWETVAQRCLSCANCTMVCPTCFCATVEEVSDLKGDQVTRVRQWDSCFNIGLSYTAGGTVRNDIRSRYRQWLTHKLATWQDQFDVSGCVGCGRCITWCPVGIDLTEEVAAIRETNSAPQDPQ